jgi:Rieske Fe-S protein
MEDALEGQQDLSRRDAMKMAILLGGGLICTALGIPTIAYLVGPDLASEEANWIRLGALSTFKPGTPTLVKAKVSRENGWVVEAREVGVYVLTEDGHDYMALSNICTHLGCHVRWIAERQQFLSPCHKGVFDKYGFVISGPPPRPLDQFLTRVDEGSLFIQLPPFKRTS